MFEKLPTDVQWQRVISMPPDALAHKLGISCEVAKKILDTLIKGGSKDD